MKKKCLKLISVLIILFICIGVISNISNASFQDVDVDFMTKDAQDTSGAAQSVKGILQAALVIAQVVGTGVAVIMLIVLAIKYLTASAADRADIKKSAVVYVTGAVILFAASGILGIISRLSSNVK